MLHALNFPSICFFLFILNVLVTLLTCVFLYMRLLKDKCFLYVYFHLWIFVHLNLSILEANEFQDSYKISLSILNCMIMRKFYCKFVQESCSFGMEMYNVSGQGNGENHLVVT